MDSYNKTLWVNGANPPINAENLNNIENGIEAATEGVTAVEQGKADISHTHPVDSAFSLTSTNPIQNVVVTRKINEIVADANNNFSNVNTQLAGKAGKSTTLAGYGITDAFTQGEIEMRLSNKADKASTYTKSKVDELLGNKVNSSDYNQKIGEIELSLQHKENDTNKVTSISKNSTDTQYASAKCVYDNTVNKIEFVNLTDYTSIADMSNFTDQTKLYHFYCDDVSIDEECTLQFIWGGEVAEGPSGEVYPNSTQIIITGTGRVLKRTSDDEGTWGSVTDVLALKEDSINKISIIDPNTATNTQYPSALAVVNYINTILGSES